MNGVGLYTIDGKDFGSEYNYLVSSGNDGFLQLYKSKEVFSYDWKGQHGKQYDLSQRFFEDKIVTVSGYIVVKTKSEFWQKYLAFWNLLRSPGFRLLYSSELEQTFKVFYIDSPGVKRFTRLQQFPGKICVKIDLQLQVMFTEFVQPGAEQLPPVVAAGGNKEITLPLHELIITGASASGQNGAIITSLLWEFMSSVPTGLTAGISNANTLTPRITGLNTAGDYNFKFTATDNNGKSSSDNMKLTVKPAPAVPPAVNAGGDKSITLPTNQITISGASAVANGGATIDHVLWEYEISIPDGLPATVTQADTLTPKFINFVSPGIYRFRLTAWDSNGNRSYSTMRVTVLAESNNAFPYTLPFNLT